MNQPFVPAWAEYELGDKTTAKLEIQMHREFFEAWEALHSIPNDKLHRNKAEQAAQKLVDISHAIKRLREPMQLPRLVHARAQ